MLSLIELLALSNFTELTENLPKRFYTRILIIKCDKKLWKKSELSVDLLNPLATMSSNFTLLFPKFNSISGI